MTPLARALADYLSMRRALGFKLKNAGGLLAQFVTYLEQTGADTVTTDRAVSWAMLPQGVDPNWWGRRKRVRWRRPRETFASSCSS